MTALSIREYHNLAVVTVAEQTRHGLQSFEIILVVEVDATHTNGESKQEMEFQTLQSIASAFGRVKGAMRAKEHETRAPVGAARRTGLTVSMMLPENPMVAAVIHGGSSQKTTRVPRRALKFAASVSGRHQVKLSVRVPEKAAAVGLFQARIPHGPCPSMIIPTTMDIACINGIWIALHFHLLFSVQHKAHVQKYSNRSQRMLSLVKLNKSKKRKKEKQTVIS